MMDVYPSILMLPILVIELYWYLKNLKKKSIFISKEQDGNENENNIGINVHDNN
jgi:hypothetical protein